MTNYRLFPTTGGPASPVSYSGSFQSGVGFEVTSGGSWFEGYWWWVCPSGQPTASQTFALWQVYQGGSASIVGAATVTSGTLTPGQWNYVSLSNPVMLSVGGGATQSHADAGGTAYYIACTALSGDFPDTNSEYDSGGPYASGIANGPLTAFSGLTGTLPAPFDTAQGVFGLGSNVTSGPPLQDSGGSNFWMDVQVSDTAPASYGGSYRIWPSLPTVPGSISNDTGQQTFGTEFWLAESCTLDSIWFWSPQGAGALPSRCGIFSVATQTEVAGTDNSSPTWSGSAGSGWVSCSYAGAPVVLPAGQYKVVVYTGGGSKIYQEDVDYFGTGPGAKSIVNGPLTCPSAANASAPGNSTYQNGPWSYPATFDADDDGETRWVDVEVTPGAVTTSPSPSPSPTPSPSPSRSPGTVNSGAFLVFFP